MYRLNQTWITCTVESVSTESGSAGAAVGTWIVGTVSVLTTVSVVHSAFVDI